MLKAREQMIPQWVQMVPTPELPHNVEAMLLLGPRKHGAESLSHVVGCYDKHARIWKSLVDKIFV